MYVHRQASGEDWLRQTVEVTVVLVGPTAAGKSSLAAALVRRYALEGRRAEIVNADSMLVYRGMDIGTAKPSEAERAEIRHHMVDLLDVTENATVAEFQQLARQAIADCITRNAIPIVVGGSALYVRAIVDDFEFPGTDPAVRARLEHELMTQGAERLHQRLSDADPVAATRILPGNARRVIRALEVDRADRSIVFGCAARAPLPTPDVVQIGIAVDRPTLDARIAARVDAMWAAGFVEEVRRLAEVGPSRKPHRLTRARVSASAALSRRGDHRGTGAGIDHHRHAEVRPPARLMVPQGPADHLVALRPPRSGFGRVRAGGADGDRRRAGRSCSCR